MILKPPIFKRNTGPKCLFTFEGLEVNIRTCNLQVYKEKITNMTFRQYKSPTPKNASLLQKLNARVNALCKKGGARLFTLHSLASLTLEVVCT